METKTEKLRDEVVNLAYCDWGIFIENVNSSGWTRKQFNNALNECETKQDFHKLINEFV